MSPAEFFAPGNVGTILAAGFNLRVGDPDFVRRTRVMPFMHTSTGMPVDVWVLAGSGLEDEFLARARQTDVYGTMLPVMDLANLMPPGGTGRRRPAADARGQLKEGRDAGSEGQHARRRMDDEALQRAGAMMARACPSSRLDRRDGSRIAGAAAH